MIRAGPPVGSAAIVRPPVGRAAWTAAAVLAFLLLTLIYIPTHGALLDQGGLGAAVAIMFLLAASIAVPRVIRGSILGEGGLKQPIAALVRGSAGPTDPLVSPRRRAAAIVAGAAISAAIAVLALTISRGQPVTGYPHAIATFIFAANAALAARALVPLPGLSGWALLLALVDLRSPDDPQRIVRAAHAAKRLSIPATFLMTAFGLATGAPIVTLLALMLGLFVWTQAEVAENRDIVDRFLAGRTAGDVARPLTAFLRADESVRTPLPAQPAVSMVLGSEGELLGFIGPRQLVQALAREAQPVACGDAMTPIEMMVLVSRDLAASELQARTDRHGFAVIRMARGLGYVEAGELVRQAHRWATAE